MSDSQIDKFTAEELRRCQFHIDSAAAANTIDDLRDLAAHITLSHSRFGVAMLAAVLHRVDPSIAERAVEVYHGICEDDEGVKSWVWEIQHRDGWDQLMRYVFDPRVVATDE